MSTDADLASLACLAGFVDSTAVDGIPTLLAAREGPVTGGLVFRVGRGDETLATSGITHLVEHLALHRQNMSDLHHNGQTTASFTVFHATGTPEEVVDFLNGVCAALRDLPLQRLATEKEILRTEATRRGPSRAFDAMSLWRYGAQGPGLAAYDEEGLPRLGADDVTDWVRTRFTRDNAAFFLTGTTVPAGLDLTLPAGRRFPVELPAETLPAKPAWFSGPNGGVVVDATVPRSTVAALFARVAARTLFRELRQEGGLSYTADCGYEPLDGERARITAHADALPETQDAVVGAMVDVLAALRAGRIDPADLVATRKLIRQETDVPDLGAAMLPALAINLLTGARIQHPDELRAEQDAVTVDDLTAVAGAFWDDALAQVPAAGLEWAGFVAAPRWSEAEVRGFTYHHLVEDGIALVVADDGVSVRTGDGVATVRYEDCVLMSAFPDGGRWLIGRDGFRVVVEPTLYKLLTPDVVASKIDRNVPGSVVQHLPARSAAEIPKPDRAAAAGRKFRVFPRWRGFGAWAAAVGTFALLMAVLLTVAGASDTSRLVTGEDPTLVAGDVVGEWFVAAVAWVGGGALVWGAVRRRSVAAR